VVAVCERELLTPFGMRTLARGDAKYTPRFEGPLFERDRAYHNGTVWPWLLGPFCEAVLRSEGFSTNSKARARAMLSPLLNELMASAHKARQGVTLPVRQLAEVYDADDGDTQRRPDGCLAQAWSVAEVLRVLRMCAQA
jgi:glycogen debranching enzyme